MQGADEEVPQQRKRAGIGGSGILLLVCAFLPTLRVCGDPMAPMAFPPAYVIHLGGLALAVMALTLALKTRRAWFSVWFTLWYGTGIAWLAMLLGSGEEVAGFICAGVGFVCAFIIVPAFHRQGYFERGFWVGGIVHGAISTGWYSLLASDHDAMWGAYVGLASSVALLVASIAAFSSANAEHQRIRRAHEPAPLPVARVIEKD